MTKHSESMSQLASRALLLQTLRRCFVVERLAEVGQEPSMSLRTARKCYVKGVPQLQEISAMLQETLNARYKDAEGGICVELRAFLYTL